MKRILFFSVVVFLASFANSQDDVVTWSTNYNANNSEVEIKATLAKGWHLYSQQVTEVFGPVPTSFSFDNNSACILVGEMKEPKAIHEFDPNFETSLDYFEDEVIFTHKIKTTQSTDLIGEITYMACNEVRCIPPSVEKFSIKITK